MIDVKEGRIAQFAQSTTDEDLAKVMLLLAVVVFVVVDYDDFNPLASKKWHCQAIANGEFIEHATFAGNTYGTSTAAVQRVRSKGSNLFSVISIYSIFIHKFSKS